MITQPISLIAQIITTILFLLMSIPAYMNVIAGMMLCQCMLNSLQKSP